MDPRTRQAFALWTQAQPAVSAFVHALVGNASDRDEVLQMVALSVLESFEGYDGARPFLPWALGVARKEVANFRRTSERFPSLSEAAQAALAVAIAEVAEGERATLVHLAECMAKLAGRPREVCELRYRSGLKPARIAEVLGMQPNTVAKALERVRAELRECIERHESLARHERLAREARPA
jgi:RNA polymerase sigma-70 factor (ECF subfamily)